MSVAVKAAAVAALLRVFVTAFPGLAVNLTPVLWDELPAFGVTLPPVTGVGPDLRASRARRPPPRRPIGTRRSRPVG